MAAADRFALMEGHADAKRLLHQVSKLDCESLCIWRGKVPQTGSAGHSSLNTKAVGLRIEDGSGVTLNPTDYGVEWPSR